MRVATAGYQAVAAQAQGTPLYFLRFFYVPVYGRAAEYPFAQDFASDVPAGYATPKLLVLDRPTGNTQTVDQMKGSSSIGTFSFPLQDRGGEVLRYLSDPQLTLGRPLLADEREWVYGPAGADISGYPTGPATLMIDSERVRYLYRDVAAQRFRIAPNGRGVDGTPIATHAGAVLHNGEQLHAGVRCQFFAGYRTLVEGDFMSFAKMEVTGVTMRDATTFVVTVADIQRTLRQLVFTATSRDNKLTLVGHPITLLLRLLLSTAAAAAGAGTAQVLAGNLVQFTGATTAGIKPGDWIALDYNTTTEQVFQVRRVLGSTEVASVQGLTTTAAGRTWRTAGPAGQYDLLGSTTVGFQVGLGTVQVTGNGTSVSAALDTNGNKLTQFKSFLAAGDVVRLNPNAAAEQSATVSAILSDTVFLSSTKLNPQGTLGAGVPYWKQVTSSNKTDGLAIAAAFVDVAGLEALRAQFPNDVFSFTLASPEIAKDFIEGQLLQPLNCYPFITQTGAYSARRFALATPVGSAVLVEDDIAGWQWDGNEARITNVVEVAYDWDLTAAPNDYSKRQRYTATASRDAFGPRPPLRMSLKGLKTTIGGQAILDDRARRVLQRFAQPPTRVRLGLKYRKNALEPGDLVTLTHAKIPNRVTGARGLINEVLEVVDITPAFGGAGGLIVTLEDTGSLVG